MYETLSRELFQALDEALLSSDNPSQAVERAAAHPAFGQPPFDRLLQLKHTPQSPLHHPEGSAWNHTLLTIDMAARVRTVSANPQSLMWAALLHDIGKPETTQKHKGRITSYNHDRQGEPLARAFLSALTDDTGLIEFVSKLTRWHMQPLFVLKDLPFADITTMRAQTDLWEVTLLSFCDRMGRLNAEMSRELEHTRLFLTKTGTDGRVAAEYCDRLRCVIMHP